MHLLEITSGLIWQYRRSIALGLPLVALMIFVLTFDHFFFKGDLRVWFEKSSAELQQYERLIKQFGSDDGIVIMMHDPKGLLNIMALVSMQRIVNELRKTSHIERVYALTNFQYVGLNPDDVDDMVIESLIRDPSGLDHGSLEALKEKMAKTPEIINRLISKDLTTAVIWARLSTHEQDEAFLRQLVGDMQVLIDQEHQSTGIEYIVHGNPVLSLAFIDIAQEDIRTFIPTVFILAFLVMALTFRSLYVAILPLIVIVLSTVAVQLFYVLSGYPLNNFTATIPVFILAVGIADSLHIVLIWRLYREHGHSNQEAIYYSLKKNIFPMSLTSLTTSIGFLTLLISHVVPLQILGVSIAFASIVAFVLSSLYTPAFLAWLDPPVTAKKDLPLVDVATNRPGSAHQVVTLLMRYYRHIIISTIAATLLMAAGLYFIKVDTDAVKMFRPDMPIRTNIELIQKYVTGPMRFEVVIDSAEQGGVYQPELLKEVERFLSEVKAHHSDVRHIFSIVDVVKRFHMLMNADDPSSYVIPDHRDEIEQYMMMYSFSATQGLQDMIDMHERSLRMTIQKNALSSSENKALIDWIEAWWEKTPYQTSISGQDALYTYLQSEVTEAMLYTVLLNLGIILTLMSVISKSLYLAFFSLIANFVPLLFVVGFMGWSGIEINMGLLISIVIILGVAIDAAIHLLIKYQHAMRKGKSIEEALVYMFTYSGTAILLSSLILIVSIGMFTFSDFVPSAQFGLITVFALIISLMTNLLLLPALLLKWHKRS